jgi:hypothetical protein
VLELFSFNEEAVMVMLKTTDLMKALNELLILLGWRDQPQNKDRAKQSVQTIIRILVNLLHYDDA